jgi:hypothetical protein
VLPARNRKGTDRQTDRHSETKDHCAAQSKATLKASKMKTGNVLTSQSECLMKETGRGHSEQRRRSMNARVCEVLFR